MTIIPAFLLLSVAGCFGFISYNVVRMPALASFAETLGAGPVAVGFILATSTMTGIVLKLPVGTLSDVVNRPRLMLIGALAFAGPPFVYPLIADVESLTVLRVIHGLATAVFMPLALATVAQMYPAARGAALGWYTAAVQGGALLGPLLGGWLVDTVGHAGAFLTGGWFGVAALAVYLMFWWHMPAPSGGGTTGRGEARAVMANVWRGVRVVLGHLQMVATSVAEAVKMTANGALMAFLPLYALSVGLSLAESGLLFGIQGFTSFVSRPVMGRVSDRAGRRPLIIMGLVVCGGAIMAIPHTAHLGWLLLCAAGFGFGEAVITSSAAALIADLGDGNVGAGMGLRGTIMDIGHAGGPIVAGCPCGVHQLCRRLHDYRMSSVGCGGRVLGVDRPPLGRATCLKRHGRLRRGAAGRRQQRGETGMEAGITMGDVVIGVLAAAGVGVLIVVFVVVCRMVFFSRDRDTPPEDDV